MLRNGQSRKADIVRQFPNAGERREIDRDMQCSNDLRYRTLMEDDNNVSENRFTEHQERRLKSVRRGRVGAGTDRYAE